MREIYPGVYVPETPKTPEYKDSRANGYVTLHTAKRYENFDLALKQAELQVKGDQDAYERRLKVAQSAVDDLDRQIAYNQKLLDDHRKGMLTDRQLYDRFNESNRIGIAKSQAYLKSTATGRTLNVLKAGTKVEEVKGDKSKEIASIVRDPKNADNLENVLTAAGKKYGRSRASDQEVAAQWAKHQLMQSDPGDTDMTINDVNQAMSNVPGAPKIDVSGNVILSSDVTEETDASRQELAASVPDIGGANKLQPRTGERLQTMGDIEARMLDIERQRGDLQRKALEVEAPDLDVIGRARGIYSDKFEANPVLREQRSVDQLYRVLEGSIAHEISQVDANDPKAVEEARQRGIQRVLYRAGVGSTPPARPAQPAAAPAAAQPTVFLDSDWQAQGNAPYKYQYDAKTDTYTVIDTPADANSKQAMGFVIKPGSPAHDNLKKGRIDASTVGQPAKAEAPSVDTGLRVPAPRPDIAYLTEKGDTGEFEFDVPVVPKAPVESPFKELSETKKALDTLPGRKDPISVPGVGPIREAVKTPSQDYKAPPTVDQRDRQIKAQAGLYASTKLVGKPKRVERLTRNAKYGRTVDDIFTAGLQELSDPTKRPQAIIDGQRAVVEAFKDDPATQQGALELYYARVLTEARSGKAQ